MFDEDELGSYALTISRPFVPDDQIEEAMAEAAALDLPFDLSNIIDYNPFVYGTLGNGARVGQWVWFKGSTATDLEGNLHTIPAGVALIIGDEFGRCVLGFEDEERGWMYLGWVLSDSFDVLNIHCEISRWTH
jgi:hypothetical protein